MMPQNILIKPSISRFFCGVRTSFGIHLLPVFYSGSIDLMMQNLLIIMFSRIVQSRRIVAALRKLKVRIVMVSVVILRSGKATIMKLWYTLHINNRFHPFSKVPTFKMLRFSQSNSLLNPLPIPIHSPPDST